MNKTFSIVLASYYKWTNDETNRVRKTSRKLVNTREQKQACVMSQLKLRAT